MAQYCRIGPSDRATTTHGLAAAGVSVRWAHLVNGLGLMVAVSTCIGLQRRAAH